MIYYLGAIGDDPLALIPEEAAAEEELQELVEWTADNVLYRIIPAMEFTSTFFLFWIILYSFVWPHVVGLSISVSFGNVYKNTFVLTSLI